MQNFQAALLLDYSVSGNLFSVLLFVQQITGVHRGGGNKHSCPTAKLSHHAKLQLRELNYVLALCLN